MKKLAIGLLWLFCLIVPAKATIVFNDPDFGGEIGTYMRFWSAIAESNDSIEINTVCVSACTWFLHYVPEERVCIGPHAALGFHQMSTDDAPNPGLSAPMFRWLYPEWIQQWIKDQGGLKSDPIFMYPEEMKDHIKLCPGTIYDPTDAQQIINHKEEETQK